MCALRKSRRWKARTSIFPPAWHQQRVRPTAQCWSPRNPLLFVTGLRIGEAAALKWTDLQGNVLSVSRRIYERKVGEVKSLRSVRKLVLDADMVARIGALSIAVRKQRMDVSVGSQNPDRSPQHTEPPFPSRRCGLRYHGERLARRHTLSTNLRRNKQHPKVISDILGHSKVNLAMDVYDRTDLQDVSTALALPVSCCQMLPNLPWRSEELLIPKELVSAEGIESTCKRTSNHLQEHRMASKAMKSSVKPENGLQMDCARQRHSEINSCDVRATKLGGSARAKGG